MMDKKICTICKEEKEFDDFQKDLSKANGHRAECRICRNKRQRELRARIVQEVVEQVEENISKSVQYDLGFTREKAKIKELEAKNRELIRLNERLSNVLDVKLGLENAKPLSAIPLIQSEGKHEATAIFLLSDWHIEERVDPRTVNGMNEYNLEIACSRIDHCMNNFIKTIRGFRSDVEINTLVLGLLGDFINGHIHEEYLENNLLSPLEAIQLAKQKIIQFIEFILAHGKFKKIIVPCLNGNHSRDQKQKFSAIRGKHSFEWLMYHDIKTYFKSEDKLQFIVSDGIMEYVDVYGYKQAFSHGDEVNFSGGYSGIVIPLAKMIDKKNRIIPAALYHSAHWHTFCSPYSYCDINGSIIGLNPYIFYKGLGGEEPCQGLRIIDSKWGSTLRTKVFCR